MSQVTQIVSKDSNSVMQKFNQERLKSGEKVLTDIDRIQEKLRAENHQDLIAN